MNGKQQRKRKQILFVTGGAILLGMVIFGAVLFLAKSSGPTVTGIYKDPTYVSPFIDEIAQQLQLSSGQLKTQAQAGKSMADIATEQGLSLTQLHIIELNAFQHLFDKGVKSGTITQQDEDQTLQQYAAISKVWIIKAIS